MSKERELAESYRERAAELRVIAEMDGRGKTRDTLEQLAADYDRMATNMDGIAATHEAMHRH